jgi:predicted amidophosphoribosyltransferase
MARVALKHICLFCGERTKTDEMACYYCREQKNLRYVPKHRICERCWLLTVKIGGHLPFYKKDETRDTSKNV